MAVNGRKENSERSMGVLQNIQHNCGPCEKDDEHIIANRYCVECREYLCNNCLKYHSRNRASKHHRLLSYEEIADADVSQLLPTETVIEMCTVHSKECIKFFCPEHKTLGCSDCIILGHRTCDIEYLQDKCKGILDSSEYKTTVITLEKDLSELNSLMTKLNIRYNVAACMHDQCIRDISTFQDQINQRIEELRKQVQKNAEDLMSKTNEDIRKNQNALLDMKTRLEQADSEMNKYKTSNQESQLFISMKKAQSILQEKAGNADETTDTVVYKFEPSQRLEGVLAESDIFGKLAPQNPESPEISGPAMNGIVVLNIPEDVTQDTVMTYFENIKDSQGGETVKVDIHIDKKYCLVFFKDTTVVSRVCGKTDYTISGNPVDVHLLHEFLGMPYSFSPDNQDPKVMNFLKLTKSKRDLIENELSKCHAKILWDCHPVRIKTMYENDNKCRCKSSRHFEEESNKVLRRFTDAVAVKTVAFTEDVWKDVLDALENVIINQPDNIAVSVRKESYEVHIICDKGHTEEDLNVILETLRPFSAKLKV